MAAVTDKTFQGVNSRACLGVNIAPPKVYGFVVSDKREC